MQRACKLRDTMIVTKKRKKKASISEEDISFLLRRYTATTIISLLQEVAQFSESKIDWNLLVKRTSTGISNAREYQMLWRHLAYRHALIEKLDGAEPLDDDSDLEYELEAFPPVSSEVSTEAATCVKVLIASVLPSNSGAPNHSTVEAPLTINVPNGQAFWISSENSQPACSTQGTNITVPVSVQKQPLPIVTTAEALDGNGSISGVLPARKKRKPWTAEEDTELIAAVKKCGEGNWANILKGDFKGDRTATQLSQRWTIIRRRQANLNLGTVNNSTGSQLSEAQLAARRAVSLALKMPMMGTSSMASSVAAAHSTPPSSSSASPALAEASPASTPMEASLKSAVGSSSSQAQQQSQQTPHQTAGTLRTETSSTTPRSRVTAKKTSSTSLKSNLGPNPMVQAAAVAAGARIATPSTAASLLKAAQSKNAVHIRPGGGSLIKTPMAGGTKPLTTSHAGPRPNVHYIRTGLTSPLPATYSGVMPSAPRPGSSQQAHGNSVRPATPIGQLPPANAVPSSNLLAQKTMSASSMGATPCGSAEGNNNNTTSTMGDGLWSKEEAKSGEEMKAGASGNVPECVQYDQAALSNLEALSENQTAMVENLKNSSNEEAGMDNQTAVVNNQSNKYQNASEQIMCSLVMEGCDDQSVVNDTGQNQTQVKEKTSTLNVTVGGSGAGDTAAGEKQTDKLGESDDG